MKTYEAYLCELQNECLMFPAFVRAFEQMEANLRLYRETGIAQNLLITGESGTGKTSLSYLFEKYHPRARLPERDVIPILRVAIPPAATIGGTAEAILARLGDPCPRNGTISAKTNRATVIARQVGVEMILLDEAQHIQDRGLYDTKYYVGDWLKAFIDALGIPVTMLGLPRTADLLQINEQLRRRFAHRLSLALDSGDAATHGVECANLFKSFAQALQTTLSPLPHDWLDFGLRLHFATDNRIAYVKQLLLGAFRITLEQESRQITSKALEETFTTNIWPAGVGALNPFHPSFVFRALDRPGEPFERNSNTRTKNIRRGR